MTQKGQDHDRSCLFAETLCAMHFVGGNGPSPTIDIMNIHDVHGSDRHPRHPDSIPPAPFSYCPLEVGTIKSSYMSSLGERCKLRSVKDIFNSQ